MKPIKKVMCFGTFDLLHVGHLHYFHQAKKYGNYLMVVIARDFTKFKQHKTPIFNEKERVQLIQSLNIVDEAVLGNKKDHFKIILSKKPDVLCLGYDHPITEKVLRQQLQERGFFPIIKRARSYLPHIHKGGKIRHKILQSL